MKTKRVAIAMAAIILASIAAMIPTASAVGVQNTDHNIMVSNITNPILIGQKLDFTAVGLGKTIIGVSPDSIEGRTFGTTSADYDTASYFTEVGMYRVEGTTTNLSVDNPLMKIDLKVGTTSVSSLAQGTQFKIDFTTNLNASDSIDLKVKNPDGNILTVNPVNDSQPFDNITVSGQGNWSVKDRVINTGVGTSYWKIGTYTIWIETNKERASGLDAKSNEKTLEVVKSTIEITADKTSVAKGGTVTLTVSGQADHIIKVNTSDSLHTQWQYGVNDYTSHTQDITDAYGVVGLNHTIDADGIRKYSVKFNDTGSYTIEVKDTTAYPAVTDTVDITVSEAKVTFDLPTTVVIGQKLTIKGTANTGSTVSIAIDDVIPSGFGSVTIDANKQFSKDIETGGNAPQYASALKSTGSVRIDAFIDKNFAAGYDTSKETADGSATILLVSGDLTAKLSTTTVALGDDFTVSGTAKGSKNVEILTVSPKGAAGKGLRTPGLTYAPCDEYTGLTYDKTSVSETDYTYSKKIDVRDDASTGYYTVAVFAPGTDGVYADTDKDNLADALYDKYKCLGTKTQDQLIAIIDDMMKTAGTDDLVFLLTIKVETAEVQLDTLKSVGVGEPLVVSGTSNRKDGYAIVITVKGPKELTPQTVTLQAGKFNATFDTTDAPVGTYTVKADDGDGHTDEATVQIVAVVPTATPTVTPSPTVPASPTAPPTVSPAATPTATPAASPTPKPPGFEAVFAIAGLLAVAYLVLRRKK